MTLRWHRLHFPSTLDGDDVLGFVRTLAMRPRHGLLQQARPLVFEVVGTPDSIGWRLGIDPTESAAVLAQLRSQLPGVRTDPLDERRLPPVASGVELKLNTARRSLKSDLDAGVSAAVLTALHQLQRHEALVLQWLIGPWLPRPLIKRKGITALGLGYERQVLKLALDPDDSTALKDKLR